MNNTIKVLAVFGLFSGMVFASEDSGRRALESVSASGSARQQAPQQFVLWRREPAQVLQPDPQHYVLWRREPAQVLQPDPQHYVLGKPKRASVLQLAPQQDSRSLRSDVTPTLTEEVTDKDPFIYFRNFKKEFGYDAPGSKRYMKQKQEQKRT